MYALFWRGFVSHHLALIYLFALLKHLLARPGRGSPWIAMSRQALFDALCNCRAFIQGPLVVKAGAESGVFQTTVQVHVDDVRRIYDAPP